MSTSQRKKETKQVRLEKSLHKELRIEAANRGEAMSKLLGRFVRKGLLHESPKTASREDAETA